MPLVWEGPTPTELGDIMEKRYLQRARVAILALMKFIGQKMQDEMRTNAPWTDRTANARTGLFTVTQKASKDLVVLYLSHGHTIEYGKWLELANQGKYAIIMPTLQRWLPEIERLLKELFA